MRADWIKLMIAAARFPLRCDPAHNQFERPSAVSVRRSHVFYPSYKVIASISTVQITP
jgi:hypothetical protein